MRMIDKMGPVGSPQFPQEPNENPPQGKAAPHTTWSRTCETVTSVFKLLFHPFIRQQRIPYFKDEEGEL